jgi:hypothetical protein
LSTTGRRPVLFAGTERRLSVARLAGRKLSGQLIPKGVRKAVAMVAEHGPEAIALIIQGRLDGDLLTECGLVAQIRGSCG